MTTWNNLFWTSALTPQTPTELIDRLECATLEAGYTRYNPFGVLPAPLYGDHLKLFAAPLDGRWGRVLSEAALPAFMLAAASESGGVCLALTLADDAADVRVYADGSPADDPAAALAPYGDPAALRAALTKNPVAPSTTPADAEPSVGGLPLDVLPPDIRKMAAQLDPKAIDKLFERMAGGAFQRGGDRAAASDLLHSASGPNWESAGGGQIRAVLAALDLPHNPLRPTFVALRDAYALHQRQARKPGARLYPGDADALRAVPNALDYTPLYAGRDHTTR